MNPLISVILPVFNAERFLRQAVDSVLNQNFKNFELIIINDGSSDASEDIIRSYLDDRIVIINNEVNLGLIKSLNKGVEIAKGKYIARMDADDVCMPMRLKKQYDFLERNNSVDICGTWAYLIDRYGIRNGRIKNPCGQALISCLLFFTCPILHPSVMGRSDIFRKFKYDEKAVHIEDFELWNRMSRSGVGFDNIPEFLMEYRWHDTNISVLNAQWQMEMKNAILHSQVEELVGRGVSEEEMMLHSLSFNLFAYGRRKTLTAEIKTMYYAERRWLELLSESNQAKEMFRKKEFDGLLLNRWVVVCVASRKFLHILTMPVRFYKLSVFLNCIKLILQK